MVKNENEFVVISVGGRPDVAQRHEQKLWTTPRGDHDYVAPSTTLHAAKRAAVWRMSDVLGRTALAQLPLR
jgi:hypothetical protein